MNRLYHPFGFRVYLICQDLKKFGEADNNGRQSAWEVTLFLCDLPVIDLIVPPNPGSRKECACYLTGDIGAYNTCGHLCRYCYANADAYRSVSDISGPCQAGR